MVSATPAANTGCCSDRLLNTGRGIIFSATVLSNFVHGYFSISGFLTAVKVNDIYAEFCTNGTATAMCSALASTVDSTPVKTLVWDLGTIAANFAAGWALCRLWDAGCWPGRLGGRRVTSLRGSAEYDAVSGDV